MNELILLVDDEPSIVQLARMYLEREGFHTESANDGEIALEKVTEMISRKIVTGEREMLSQVYLKKGALVPMHSHESEQMTYVLQGALKFLINGEEITVREGEVLHIPSWVEHQAEALDDTFELDLFSPIRQDWLDHTDTYFQRT